MTSEIKPDTQQLTRTSPGSAPSKVDGAPTISNLFGPVFGGSAVVRGFLNALERIAPTDTPVLIEGETGCDEVALARAVHDASARSASALVVFDCTAAVATLEIELFGQERGPTGAPAGRMGALESAAHSTLLLHQVSDLPFELQTKLAKALETREYRPVGSARALAVESRIIATSSCSLRREVERGRFSPELLARVSGLLVEVPPLRRRREDVPVIASAILKRIGDSQSPAMAFVLSEDASAALAGHDWPGNVDELRAVLTRAADHANLTGETELRFVGLPSSDRPADPYRFHIGKTYRETRSGFEAEFERRYVKWLLTRHHGNISAAAREVQMDRKYLYDLAKKHGMRGKDEHAS